MLVVLTDIQQQLREKRQFFGRSEPQNRSEIPDMIKIFGGFKMKIPIVFQRDPFIQLIVPAGLETVLDAQPDECLFLYLVDIIKIIQLVIVDSRFGDIGQVEIRHHDMPQTVNPEQCAFRRLPCPGNFHVAFQSQFDIQTYNDYVVPNTVVEDGTVDANYFQHTPYLDDFNKENGTHIVSVAAIHVEPMGLYGGKQTTLDALK